MSKRRQGRRLNPLGVLTVGILASAAASALLKGHPPGGAQRWIRTNFVGRPVTLLEGPAFALGAVFAALAGGAGAPAVVAGLGAGAFGVLDDLVGDGSTKGLGGHLAAALHGEVTTGAIKIAGLGATGLLGAWTIDRRRSGLGPVATLVGGAVIAGSANIANLFDLRPGRALKVVLLLALPLAATPGARLSAATAGAAAGASIGLLPDDLAGRSMLGDTGANSAGALIGTALLATTGLRGRLLALAGVCVLTLASEKVSFTQVIESTPGIRRLDALGRPRG